MGGKQLKHDAIYWAFRIFLEGGSRLPLALTRPAGRVIGRVALVLASRDRRRAMEHLKIAWPELDEAGRRRILRATALHLGETLAEVVWLWRAAPEAILARTEVRGFEHLRSALEQGRGAVLITCHCGNWEWLNAVLGIEGIPMSLAVRSLYDPRMGRLAHRLRARFGAEVFERSGRAGRQLIGAIRKNRVAGLLIDQDIRDIPGVFVPFFGRDAWTPAGAAQLALAVGAPVVPAFIHRGEDGIHVAEAHPPLPVPETADRNEAARELTAAATAAIEAHIRRHPPQWVWMHRRWRTRPEDVAKESLGS